MNDSITRKQISRFFLDGRVDRLMDDLIQEYRLAIRIDGKDFIEVVLSPMLMEEFVLGFLLTRGLIHKYEDVMSLQISEGWASVTRVHGMDESLPLTTVLESTGTRNIDMEKIFTPRDNGKSINYMKVPLNILIDGIRMLREMPLYSQTGGAHCAILFSTAGEVFSSAEDLGRHNSVDKVIGGGLIKKVDFSKSWLAVSGRLPKDMVLKAVLTGIPLIASISAATSGGVEAGETSGVTVVGFAREGRVNCYSHPERIVVS